MQLLCLGLDHHNADVKHREQMVVPASRMPDVLGTMREHLSEGVLLSTCNRTELYALVGHQSTGRRAALHFLSDVTAIPVDQIKPILVEHWQAGAVRHLYRVTAGLESMIVGEHQILGQVRDALASAVAAGCTGPVSERLFRDALSVGKRVRVESGIARSPVSVSTAAVDLAQRSLGTLAGASALVVGAGKMGALAARCLAAKKVARLAIVSRDLGRARDLAGRVGGEAVAFDALADALSLADVVISSTAAPGYVITASMARRARAHAANRPLVLVDVAVPRDVDPLIGQEPGCTVFNIDDLAAVQEASLASRRQEIGRVEALIEPEIEKFMAWWAARQVAPTIGDLVAQAEQIRIAELDRALARLGPLSDRDRNTISAMTVSIVNKLLHRPIVQLKQRGGNHDAEVYVHAVRELFDLPGRRPADDR